MKCSLILATVGRDIELEHFLNSLKIQSYRDFELIIIDQNNDGKIDFIVEQFAIFYPVKHIKVNFKGVGRARDYGIQYACGSVIAIPDDDCIYEVDVLEKVMDLFERKKELSIVAGGSYDFDKTKFSLGLNSCGARRFSRLNIMGVEYTHFFNINKIDRNDFYLDHDFGIGSKYLGGEGWELMYRLMKKGNKAFYTPDIRIYHANTDLKDYALGGDRIYRYSYSTGIFIRKFMNEGDPLMIYYIARKMFVAPIFKMLLAAFLFNTRKFRYSYINLIGIWQGFFAYGK